MNNDYLQPIQPSLGSGFRPQLNPNLQQVFFPKDTKAVPKTTTNKHKIPITGPQQMLITSTQQRNNNS